MTSLPTTPARFIGCDVGKTSIVVFASHTGQTQTIPNRPQEHHRYAAALETK